MKKLILICFLIGCGKAAEKAPLADSPSEPTNYSGRYFLDVLSCYRDDGTQVFRDGPSGDLGTELVISGDTFERLDYRSNPEGPCARRITGNISFSADSVAITNQVVTQTIDPSCNMTIHFSGALDNEDPELVSLASSNLSDSVLEFRQGSSGSRTDIYIESNVVVYLPEPTAKCFIVFSGGPQ